MWSLATGLFAGQRVCVGSVSHSTPHCAVFYLSRAQGLLGTSCDGLTLFCPEPSPASGIHTTVPCALLTTSEFTASGTVCAIDSPALAFLPLKQPLGSGLGHRAFPHSSWLKSAPPPPGPLDVITFSKGFFCGAAFFLFPEISLESRNFFKAF